jgi:uncharacterized delta-60 repeat protein
MKKILVFLILFLPHIAIKAQQAGALDTGFSSDGKVEYGFLASISSFKTIVQPDGKIVVAGVNNLFFGSYYCDFHILRFNQNGSLDNTFGSGGVTTINIYSGFSNIVGELNGLKLQADGKIVVVGALLNGTGGRVIRLNANGTSDNTFGSSGVLTISSISGVSINNLNDVAIQSNGKIVVAGLANNTDFAVIRINADGTFDLGFSGDGLQTTNFTVSSDVAKAVGIQPDGKIVVGGDNNSDFLIARYSSTGTLDNTFDTDGRQTVNFNATDVCNSLLIQPDGKILMGGNTFTTTEILALCRLNTDGAIDISFGGAGKYSTPDGGGFCSLALQSDNRIVVTTTKNPISSPQILILRLNPHGALDTSFDTDGKQTLSFGFGSEYANSVAIQADGKIIVGCYNDDKLLLARFHAISDFNTNNNKVYASFGTSNDIANAVAVRPDGKIVSAGYSLNAVSATSDNDFTIVQHNVDGSLDYTFGNNAKVITDIGTNTNDQIKGMLIQSDGKIVVVGSTTATSNNNSNATTPNIVIARYLADGSALDATFGVGGKYVFDAFGTNDDATSIVLHPNGNYYIGGGVVLDNANRLFILVKVSSTGTSPTYVATSFGSGFSSGRALVIQSDGKIIQAGTLGGDFALARYLLNASGNPLLDNTFNGNGKVLTTSPSFEEVKSMALQSDGKILVSGNTDANGTDDLAVFRYNSNGSLDNTFGTAGKVMIDVLPGASEGGATMALYASEKILLAGQSSANALVLCRLNTNGTLDTGFDGDGKMTMNLGYSYAIPNAMAIQEDGKMVLAGRYNNGTNDDFALFRINGINDFSVNKGRMMVNLGWYNNLVRDMATQPDGKIILGGINGTSMIPNSTFPPTAQIVLTRFNTNGSLDNTFDADGIVQTTLGSVNSEVNSISIQSDGKILAGGIACSDVKCDMGLTRYNSNGSLDVTFGTGGKKIITSSLNEWLYDIKVQSDGKILSAGILYTSALSTSAECAFYRLNADGTVDNTFGTSGKTTVNVGTGAETLERIAIQPDGKIVAIGYFKNGTYNDSFVLRLTTTGILDNSFDGDGILTIPMSTTTDFAASLDIQSDGKIVVGGEANNGSNNDIFIFRINPNGTFDNTFDGDGKQFIAFGTNNNIINKLSVLPNGDIIVVGSTNNGTTSEAIIVRVNTNGTLDTSFDTDGKFTTLIGSQFNTGRGIHVSNNTVYMGGNYLAGTNYDFFLQKLPFCFIETPNLVNSADNYPNAALPNPVIGKTITATNLVNPSSNITYRSSSSITLNPGFKAESGAVFKTEIVGCSY